MNCWPNRSDRGGRSAARGCRSPDQRRSPRPTRTGRGRIGLCTCNPREEQVARQRPRPNARINAARKFHRRLSVSAKVHSITSSGIKSLAGDTGQSIQFQRDPQKFLHRLRGCSSRRRVVADMRPALDARVFHGEWLLRRGIDDRARWLFFQRTAASVGCPWGATCGPSLRTGLSKA